MISIGKDGHMRMVLRQVYTYNSTMKRAREGEKAVPLSHRVVACHIGAFSLFYYDINVFLI